MKILIVDDEETNIEILEGHLKKEGFDCITAKDGEEGKQIIENRKDEISLVLLDIYILI